MRLILSCLLLLICFAIPSQCFSKGQKTDYSLKVSILNQTPISLSPKFKDYREMFSMRILDHNRQIVGIVEDIKVDSRGRILKLLSKINNLNRENKIVENDAYEFMFHENMNAFEIPLHLGSRAEAGVNELSAIEPSAGDEQLFGAKNLNGSEVKSESGRWIGEVKNILFDSSGTEIKAIVIQDVPGARRYKEIAVPMDPSHVRIIKYYDTTEFRLSAEAAKSVTDFAARNR